MLLRGGQLQQGLDLRRRKRRRGPLLLHTSSRRCLPSQTVPLTLSPFLLTLAILFPVKLFLPEMEFQRQIYSPGLSTRYSWRMVFKSEFESPKFDAYQGISPTGIFLGKGFSNRNSGVNYNSFLYPPLQQFQQQRSPACFDGRLSNYPPTPSLPGALIFLRFNSLFRCPGNIPWIFLGIDFRRLNSTSGNY